MPPVPEDETEEARRWRTEVEEPRLWAEEFKAQADWFVRNENRRLIAHDLRHAALELTLAADFAEDRLRSGRDS